MPIFSFEDFFEPFQKRLFAKKDSNQRPAILTYFSFLLFFFTFAGGDRFPCCFQFVAMVPQIVEQVVSI